MHEMIESFVARVLELAAWQRKTAAGSKRAPWSGEPSELYNMTSVQWLSGTAGMSEEKAHQIIARLGVPIADRFAWNAGTPRCLLGLVATLTQKPEVLLYSTSGLDAEGCHAVHRYIASSSGALSAVHISYPSAFGNGMPAPRLCPTDAHCVELDVVEDADDQNSF
jgi:hypothetical protein